MIERMKEGGVYVYWDAKYPQLKYTPQMIADRCRGNFVLAVIKTMLSNYFGSNPVRFRTIEELLVLEKLNRKGSRAINQYTPRIAEPFRYRQCTMSYEQMESYMKVPNHGLPIRIMGSR